MAAIYHAEIPVDLAGASRERPLPVQFFRGDNDSHIFTAWVGDSANPEAGLLAGTVAGTALRGDGVTVPLSGEKGSATVPVTFNGITVQATPCRVTLPQAAFRIPGMIKVSILLTDGGITTTVLSLSGSVIQTNTDAVTDPEELIPNLSALQTAAAQAIAAAEDAETAAESVPALVAPTFNTTTAYAAGDYVYYNGSIWRFTTAHAAGAWTGSDAVQTTVTDEYSDLKSALPVQNYVNIGPGSIDGSSGQDGPTTATTRARTNGYIPIDELWYCNTRDTAYGMIVFLYDANKTYIKRLRTNFTSELVDRELLKNYSNAVYVRFAFSKSNAQMGAADYANISAMIRVYRQGDSPIVNGETTAQEAENASLTNIESNHFSTTFSEIEIGTISASNGQDSSSTARCRTKGYIGLDRFVCCNLVGTSYKMMYFMYDAQKAFIRLMPFEYDYIDLTRYSVLVNNQTAKYVRIAFLRADGAAMTDADIVYLRTKVFVTVDSRKVDEDRARFDKQFNYVAYSQITPTDAPPNTEEHFLNCANAGTFTALKGDVRDTADGGLIMCHDEGFTLDGNGKITAYNSSNKTLIDTLTVAQCKALTFANQWNGKDCHPCDFETFVQVCKKYGLICYVTVRDEHIADIVAPEVLRILTLYRMLDHAIINSFTKSTLEIFRALNPSITLSLVLGNKYIPTNADIDYVVSLGNCNLNLFNVPLDSSVPGTNVEDKLENWLSGTEYAAVLEYAHSKNVVLYDAQTGNAAPDVLLRHGIVGAHMTVVPVWDWKRS